MRAAVSAGISLAGPFSLHRLVFPRVRAVSSSQWCHPRVISQPGIGLSTPPLKKPSCASFPWPRGLAEVAWGRRG